MPSLREVGIAQRYVPAEADFKAGRLDRAYPPTLSRGDQAGVWARLVGSKPRIVQLIDLLLLMLPRAAREIEPPNETSGKGECDTSQHQKKQPAVDGIDHASHPCRTRKHPENDISSLQFVPPVAPAIAPNGALRRGITDKISRP